MSAAEPPRGANCAPSGGSAAAKPQAWGDHTSAAGPAQGAHDEDASSAFANHHPPQQGEAAREAGRLGGGVL